MNSTEIWKSIKNYEKQYEISNFGNVRSIDRYIINNGTKVLLRGKTKLPKKNGIGYLHVTLYKNSKGKNFYIHRLVAEYFIPNNNLFYEVNHKNGNKANNFYWNLEWSTRKKNFKHAVKKYLICRDIRGRFLKKKQK